MKEYSFVVIENWIDNLDFFVCVFCVCMAFGNTDAESREGIFHVSDCLDEEFRRGDFFLFFLEKIFSIDILFFAFFVSNHLDGSIRYRCYRCCC